MTLPARTFKIVLSERCYRFKPDALGPHAPRANGVYEFVTFNEKLEPRVLYVGLALPGTIHDALAEHLMGRLKPTAQDLFEVSKDIYFDYVAQADTGSSEELKDVAAGLIQKHGPRFNQGLPPPSSGRYASVAVEEAG